MLDVPMEPYGVLKSTFIL